MASFDVKSLFTNIVIIETIDFCVENFYKIQANIDSISKSFFRRLSQIKFFESYFIFNQNYIKQCDGVAVGSPPGPMLINVFMCQFQNFLLKSCRTQFKPVVHRRYVDDTFSLFRSSEHVKEKCLTKRYKILAFTSEIKQNVSLSFLNTKIRHENKTFFTLVYQ